MQNTHTQLLHYTKAVKFAFNNETKFRIILEKSITKAISSFPKSVHDILWQFNSLQARYLCLYIDSELRASTSDDQTEQNCEIVFDLVRFLSEKDLFKQYYTMDLALRLLNKTYKSKDLEVHFMSKLMIAYGVSFAGFFISSFIFNFLQKAWRECSKICV